MQQFKETVLPGQPFCSLTTQCCQAIHTAIPLIGHCCQTIHTAIRLMAQCCQTIRPFNEARFTTVRMRHSQARWYILPNILGSQVYHTAHA